MLILEPVFSDCSFLTHKPFQRFWDRNQYATSSISLRWGNSLVSVLLIDSAFQILPSLTKLPGIWLLSLFSSSSGWHCFSICWWHWCSNSASTCCIGFSFSLSSCNFLFHTLLTQGSWSGQGLVVSLLAGCTLSIYSHALFAILLVLLLSSCLFLHWLLLPPPVN